MEDTVSTSRTEILECVQQFSVQILKFLPNSNLKFLVVKTDLSNAVLIQSNWVYSNQGCSAIFPSKLERICSLFQDQRAK